MDDVAAELLSTDGNGQNLIGAVNAAKVGNSTTDVGTTKETPTKCETNDSKNSSLEEDLLGVNSLLMSDSDDDDNRDTMKQGSNVQMQELSTSKATDHEASCHPELNEKVDIFSIDTDNTETESLTKSEQLPENPVNLVDFPNVVTEAEEQESDVGQKKKKKFLAILDSDSDESQSGVTKKQSTNEKSRFSALIDSESDSDNEEKSTAIKKNNKFIPEDSENVNNQKTLKKTLPKMSKQKLYSFKPGLIDSDSDTNSDSEQCPNEEYGIVNEELDNLQQMEVDTEEHTGEVQRKPIRASAKKALDEMQAIQSEQQRLHREAHISVPYHKPKRYTIHEFLKRRTIIKPAAENERSPVAAILRKKNLKMTSEELEEYAKLMEERAKEATEFFKSESESDEEELKDNIVGIDIEVDKRQNGSENSENKNENYILELKELLDGAQVDTPIGQTTEKEIIDRSDKELGVPQCSSQALVTEVLELPNLDLSTLHFNEKDEIASDSIHITTPAKANSTAVHRDIEDLKKQIFNEQNLTESPTIKGDLNMIIDLESGDMTEKKPTGADNLLQRLLATHRARKTKTSESVNILSNENGKLEITKVNVHIKDEDGVNKDQKPGAGYVKLKENLKTLIKKKRLEEMQKKQEDENEYKKCLEGDDDDYNDEDEERYDEECELQDDEEDKAKECSHEQIIIDEEENAAYAFDDDDNDADVVKEATDRELHSEAENDEPDGIEDEIDEIESTEEPESDKNSSDSEDDDELNSNPDFKLPPMTTQRKNRIIKAFAADSDVDGDDDMDLLKTQIPTVQTNIENSIFGKIVSPLKSCISMPCSDIGIENTQELLGLCSGSFDMTQKPTQNPSISAVDTVIISQIPMTQRSRLNDASEELLGLCSGTFDVNDDQQQDGKTKPIDAPNSVQDPKEERVEGAFYKILSSEEEGLGVTAETDTRKRVKKLRKKLKKRQVKLGFSDDEDEDDGVNHSNNPKNDDDAVESIIDDDEIEMPQAYVEYDSEENEIIVEMTKEDCVKRAENFFEKEAELSESDWGSADEDEKNMDQYDIELGDEDEFDRGQLQQELGQIHARKMLDDDIREMRKIQEMLFEDEETDGVGRQRQFRWKNAENGFNLDDMRAGGNGEDGVGGESGDEEQKQEHLWRKIRFEREQMLKEQGFKENSQDHLLTLNINSPQTTIISKNSSISKNVTPILGSNGKKIELITRSTTSTTAAKQKGSPFLISSRTLSTKTATIVGTTPPTTSILKPKVMRGSFLTRDKDMLTKFANLTKSKSATGYDDNETAGSVSSKGKNFVFTTLTKEEHEHLKRKAEDLMNSSNETGTNFMKKPRMSGDKQCLIDQLLT